MKDGMSSQCIVHWNRGDLGPSSWCMTLSIQRWCERINMGLLSRPCSYGQKERAMTTPKEWSTASAHAERMTITAGVTTWVIVWYHSHPHILPFPSQVWCADSGYIYWILALLEVIFSCFNYDTRMFWRTQVIAIQSLDENQNITYWNLFVPSIKILL